MWGCNVSVYIWSDLHLNHENIIKYESRPFSSVKEMNKTLLDNWKKTVKKHDTIINLGDVSFRGGKEWNTEQISNMPGKKVLVLGNHDRGRSLKWWYDVGFNEVYKYPIIYNDFYILSHEPQYINENMPYVNIHGHCHLEKSSSLQKVNVCVENIDYMPVNIETIFDKYKGEKE